MPVTGRGIRPGGRRVLWAVALVAAVLVVPPSPLWSGLGVPSAIGVPEQPSVTVAPAYVPGPGVSDLGPMRSSELVDVAVSLTSGDETGLAAQLALEYTPGTPEYHHFLSNAQVTEELAPSDAAYRAASAYLQELGLSVLPSPDRLLLLIEGRSDLVAAAFHTQFETYREGGTLYYSHPIPATLPAIAPWAGAVGLGNQSAPRPFVDPSTSGSAGPASGGCPLVIGLSPCAVASAYNASGFYGSGENGTGYRIGVVDTYDGGEPQPTLQSDLRTFTTEFGLPVGNVQYVYPVQTLRNLNASYPGWSLEDALDLEWSRAMAPGASIDMTLAPDSGATLYYSIDWLVAHQAVNVISLSWGEPDIGTFNSYASACSSGCNATSDGSYTILHPVLVAAALEGIGVFSASGDCGAAMGTNGDSTSYPASDSYVTGVGATNLALANGQYGAESGWSGNDSGAKSPGCQNQGGSGGGFAPLPRPYWQVDAGLPTTPATRGVPDVSIVGGTPVVTVVDGFNDTLQGTSVSTPIWAGLATVADQLHGAPLGFLNPSLYALARGPSSTSLFHDVLQGSNGYSAGPGWDPVTGIGSPIASQLLPALSAGTVVPTGIFTELRASARFGPAPLTVTLSANASGGALPYAGFDLDFGDGNATWSTTGVANHTYPMAGTYIARAQTYDSNGNSSSAPPLLIVVGGGGALNVSLVANATHPMSGTAVQFTASVTGGASPYRYSFSFGDGTFAQNGTVASLSHSYAQAGGYCANVLVRDAAAPPDGGASLEVPITVGGAAAAPCDVPSRLTVSLGSSVLSADLPGDLPLQVTTTGGAAPIQVHLVSDDAYVTACQCGIFRTAGAHTITAYANDSLESQVTATLSVDLYPALRADFQASPLSGTGPLDVGFLADVSGGHGANAASTVWSFGDGSANVTGSSVNHTFTEPGIYIAEAVVRDAGNGTGSETFVVDVRSPSAPGALGASATITPGPTAALGAILVFNASASGGAGGYRYRWSLGDNDSAFGPSVEQSYSAGCLSNSTCPLVVGLSVEDANGTYWNVTIPVADPIDARASAVYFSDSGAGTGGPTPYHLQETAVVAGMPNLTVGWTFGDGESANGTNVSHSYLLPGNYTLTEVATDPLGDRLVRTHALAITGLARSAPEISGGARWTVGVAPLLVQFALHAAGGGGAPYSFAWDFGDGTTGNGSNATHIYYNRGNYSAVVTVTDALDDPNSTTFPISVYNVTYVQLNATLAPTRVVPGAPVELSVSATVACTSGSVPGCSASALVVNATIEGAVVLTVPYPIGGISQEFNAPESSGSYDVHVQLVGTNYSGSADVGLGVAASSSPGSNPLWAEALGTVAGGGIAAAVFVGIFRRRPVPPVTP